MTLRQRVGADEAPHQERRAAMTAVTPKTTLSSPRLRECSSSSIGTAKIGCDPVCPFGAAAEGATRRRAKSQEIHG